MSEQVMGMGMSNAMAAHDAVLAQPRPRIGADRFRALADRLRKPALAGVEVAANPVVPELMPQPVPPMLPPVVAEVQHAEPALASVETWQAPVEEPTWTPDVVEAAPPVTEPVAEFAPYQPEFAQEVVETPVQQPALPTFEPLQPEAQRDAVDTIVDVAPAFEPAPAIEAPPAIDTQPVAQAEPAFVPDALPPVVAPEPAVIIPQADEIAAVAENIAATLPELPAFEPLTPQVQPVAPSLSPMERVLAHHHEPVVEIALPEILPPPEPPPEPKPLPVIEGVELAAPSMEEVQERLKEDASNRMQQLDIENIWRQVLASPTLEERADYLREAAEIMILEGVIDAPTGEIAPEHDLSRIAPVSDLVPEPAYAEIQLETSDFNENALIARAEAEQLETAELARSLMDMMASGSNSGLPHERALAADTLLRLLPKLAVKPLSLLAQRLAMMDNPPQLLVGRLIRDERIDVSGPLLEDCMHITDHDLSLVFAEDNTDKLRMIARRRRLSRAIADQLIATEDPSVLLTLVRNAAAEISHDGFHRLICLAPEMPDIMAPLSTRNDLSAPSAFELFWAVPAQLRRYLLNRFLTDSETLTKILKITLSTNDQDDNKEAKPSTIGEITEYLEMACRGKIETAASKLATSLGVEPATIERILLDREGEGMVVMLKAAAYPRSNVGDLLRALQRGEVTVLSPERDVTELQSMFDTLSNNKARILLTYWDWSVKKSGPYAPVH